MVLCTIFLGQSWAIYLIVRYSSCPPVKMAPWMYSKFPKKHPSWKSSRYKRSITLISSIRSPPCSSIALIRFWSRVPETTSASKSGDWPRLSRRVATPGSRKILRTSFQIQARPSAYVVLCPSVLPPPNSTPLILGIYLIDSNQWVHILIRNCPSWFTILQRTSLESKVIS